MFPDSNQDLVPDSPRDLSPDGHEDNFIADLIRELICKLGPGLILGIFAYLMFN